MAFGDTHGEEEVAYAEAREWERRNKKRIHAVLFPGDLDTIVREEAPDAIRSMVADYYYGSKKAPYMTFFVAGNTDEWGVLRWFPGGGFIAQNMFFLGRSGYADFMGIRIAGLSGIYNKREYENSLPKEPNFLPWQCYRRNEVENLKAWHPDIVVLHEWVNPDSGKLCKEGDAHFRELCKMKKTPLREVIETIQPKYVFMGHKHDLYVEGTISQTQIYGLMRVTKESNLRSRYCYKVVSIEAPI